MSEDRVAAFTDGVMAIIITILVLNLAPPDSDSIRALFSIEHKLIVYCFSFIVIAVYWNNHHHLFQLVQKVDGNVLWANNFFLFSLTLFPFSASWVSSHLFSLIPQLTYGCVILLADIAYWILLSTLKRAEKMPAAMNELFSSYHKSLISIAMNILALILGLFLNPVLVMVVNSVMILLWIIPEKRIESFLN